MPELPDVEVFRRYLESAALHQRIRTVAITSEKVFHGASPRVVRKRLEGHRIIGTRRHGKLLFGELDRKGGFLMMHFGLTGGLAYYGPNDPEPAYARVILQLDNGNRLAYTNRRQLGEIDMTEDVDAYVTERGFGRDALAITESEFIERLAGRRGAIKSALMEQSILAGIGNIYSDEILFHARVHPATTVSALDHRDLARLYRHMRSVLELSIERGAAPEQLPRSWLLPSRDRGQRCPRCRTTLERMALQQRSSYFCPTCQPAL